MRPHALGITSSSRRASRPASCAASTSASGSAANSDRERSSSRVTITSQSALRSRAKCRSSRSMAATNCSARCRIELRSRSMRCHSVRSIGPSKPARCSSGILGTRGGVSQSSQNGSGTALAAASASTVSATAVIRPDIEHQLGPVPAQAPDRLPWHPVRRQELDRHLGGAAEAFVNQPFQHPHLMQGARRASIRPQPAAGCGIVLAKLQDGPGDQDQPMEVAGLECPLPGLTDYRGLLLA